MYYLGIDVHKKFSQVAVLNNDGKLKMNNRLLNNREHFSKLLNELDEPCKAVIESGYCWGAMYDLLSDLGIDVSVAHALKVKAIASAKIKTDTIDANILAKLLSADLIPEIYIPSKDIRHQKDVLRQRCWLVKLKTMLKNRIHQIINRNHIETPGITDLFGSLGRKFIGSLQLPQPDHSLLHQNLNILDFINEQIKITEKWIDEYLKDNEYQKIIQSFPGFGKILSALAALEIADINRFSKPSKLSAYSGLTPTIYASGGKIYNGNLNPQCNHWLRYAFVEASWSAISCSVYFRSFYARLRKRKDASTAIINVARRLSEIVFWCLKEHRCYEERIYAPCFKPACYSGR